MTTTTRYMDPAETAKHLRRELKETFPGVKFSVRTDKYAGGASIRVSWTDGPFDSDVAKVAGKYAGTTFDGMIDLASSVGDQTIGGELVRNGNDYVFTSRELSDAYREQLEVVAHAAALTSNSGKPIAERGHGDTIIYRGDDGELHIPRTPWGDDLHAIVRDMSERIAPKAGDDAA